MKNLKKDPETLFRNNFSLKFAYKCHNLASSFFYQFAVELSKIPLKYSQVIASEGVLLIKRYEKEKCDLLTKASCNLNL